MTRLDYEQTTLAARCRATDGARGRGCRSRWQCRNTGKTAGRTSLGGRSAPTLPERLARSPWLTPLRGSRRLSGRRSPLRVLTTSPLTSAVPPSSRAPQNSTCVSSSVSEEREKDQAGAAVRGTSPATFQARAVKRSWPAPRAPPTGFLCSPACSSVKCGEEGPFRRAGGGRGTNASLSLKGPGRCPPKAGALPPTPQLPRRHRPRGSGGVEAPVQPRQSSRGPAAHPSEDRGVPAAVLRRWPTRSTRQHRGLQGGCGEPRTTAGRRGDGQGAGGKKRNDAEGGGRSEAAPSCAALVSDILEEAKPRTGRRQWSPGAWRFRGQGSCHVWY